MQHIAPLAHVTEDQLVEVVESVFSAMLYLPAIRQRNDSAVLSSTPLVSYVHISGAWTGTALFLCSEQFGRRAASIMLEVAPMAVKLTDIHDAIAELANIMGGGIKSILPGPSTLSLPTVIYGSHYNVNIPRTTQVARIELLSNDEPMQLRLLQALADQ